MKRNTIDFYKNSMKEGPTAPFIPMALGVIVALAGFIGALPPFSGMWSIYCLVGGFLCFFVNLFLYKNSAYRLLDQKHAQRRLWERYESLHVDDKRALPLSLEDVLDMTPHEADTLEQKVRVIAYERVNLDNERRKVAGKGRVLCDMADEIIKGHQEDSRIMTQVNKNMDSINGNR